MTYTPAGFDANPLANPFNTRLGKKGITHTKNASQLAIPNQDIPVYGSLDWEQQFGDQNARLTVPNQDAPSGDQLQKSGFIGNNDRLFRLADGTVIDFKTGKILHEIKPKDPTCWGDRTLNAQESFSWNDDTGPTIDDLINKINEYNGNPSALPDSNLDKASIEYWLKAEEEAEKLKNSLTDAQKAMISAFEQHFPKSRLIEESKKLNRQS